MRRTTIYLPDDLKLDIERIAHETSTTEAAVIREALVRSLQTTRPRPRSGLFAGAEPIADRVDELLDGFGTR